MPGPKISIRIVKSYMNIVNWIFVRIPKRNVEYYCFVIVTGYTISNPNLKCNGSITSLEFSHNINTRGNRFRSSWKLFHNNLQLCFFSRSHVNIWNSLPDERVSSVGSFMYQLNKVWSNQEVIWGLTWLEMGRQWSLCLCLGDNWDKNIEVHALTCEPHCIAHESVMESSFNQVETLK